MSILILAILFSSVVDAAPSGSIKFIDIAPVWSGHPVGFRLLTHKEMQFAAFYDAERRMTVASRQLDSSKWHFVRLPETLGWDSHNSIVMAIDDDDCIHLSGNMHVAPLVYFRTQAPMDIDSFERMPMVGEREARVTYPKFLRGAENELLFCYRDGSSGNGEEIYNRYDHETRQWRRFLDAPLTSGEGERNAYIVGPTRGPDKRFHLCWVWRDHPGCESNHSLSYAVSSDLLHWETGAGAPLTLPMTLSSAEVVDPVPVNGGIINGNTRIGFDSQKRPVISYHKFDKAGHTQIYNARLEDGQWRIYQTSHWAYRWEFSGGGTIPFEIHVCAVSAHGEGALHQEYSHSKYGRGAWLLREADFQIVEELPSTPAYPPELQTVLSNVEGMQPRRAEDSGKAPAGMCFLLQWETLPQNRDRPREGPLPEPSMLRLIVLESGK